MTAQQPSGPSEAAKAFVSECGWAVADAAPVARLFDTHVAQATERYREVLSWARENLLEFNHVDLCVSCGHDVARPHAEDCKLLVFRAEVAALLDGPAHDRDAEGEGGRG